MTDIAIRVENLSKRYRIGARQKRANTLRESLQNLAASPFDYLRGTLRGPSEEEIIWALKDVSFEVKRGEVLGIPSTGPSAGSGQALGATGRGRLRLLRQAQYKAEGPLPHHRRVAERIRPMNDLPIEISHHARQQMQDRGVEQAEVIAAIREGQAEPACKNRTMYQKNFQFDGVWRGRRYRIK